MFRVPVHSETYVQHIIIIHGHKSYIEDRGLILKNMNMYIVALKMLTNVAKLVRHSIYSHICR